MLMNFMFLIGEKKNDMWYYAHAYMLVTHRMGNALCALVSGT